MSTQIWNNHPLIDTHPTPYFTTPATMNKLISSEDKLQTNYRYQISESINALYKPPQLIMKYKEINTKQESFTNNIKHRCLHKNHVGYRKNLLIK